MNPLVSIITPTYNHEKFIAECIESVLSQTYPYWEMIIIDDASTDRTPYIVEEYAQKDKRIKFIRHEKNWGMYKLADTYNQALELSQGEYIAILEGDDFWPPDKLEKQIKYFEDPEVVLIYGRGIIVSANNEILSCDSFSSNSKYKLYFLDKKLNLYETLLQKCFITSVTVMIRKKILVKIKGFQQICKIPVIDYPTWIRISLEGNFLGSKLVLGYHRVNASSQSLKRVIELANKGEKIAEYFYFMNRTKKNNDLKKIKQSWLLEKTFGYWIYGRFLYFNLNKKESQKNFLKGITVGKINYWFNLDVIKSKFLCLCGFLLTCFHVNIETIIKLFKGRKITFIESTKN